MFCLAAVLRSDGNEFCSTFFFFYLFYNLGDKERKNKKSDGEEDFEWYQFSPVAWCPYIFQRTNEKGKNKCAHDDAKAGAEQIVLEMDFGKAHAEIHRGEGKIYQAQIENCCETITLNGIVIFF